VKQGFSHTIPSGVSNRVIIEQCEQLDNLSCLSIYKYLLFINDDDDERTKTYDNQLMNTHRYEICNTGKLHTHKTRNNDFLRCD
jgi:hypothetical protein